MNRRLFLKTFTAAFAAGASAAAAAEQRGPNYVAMCTHHACRASQGGEVGPYRTSMADAHDDAARHEQQFGHSCEVRLITS
jgi:hypothetical protein